MRNNKDLLELFNRVSGGQASDEDIRTYNRWCHSFQERGLPVPHTEEITARMLVEIRKQLHHHSGIYRLRLWTKIAAAASVILIIAAGWGYLMHKPRQPQTAVRQTNDVAPGSMKAVLTLANGQTIILDSAHTGQLANQGNSTITKINSGLLAYRSGGRPGNQDPVVFNTLTVPRGGQYRLILPDGTKVWLNAASSIRYPTTFTGNERKVAVTGEVYMEVAEDPQHPFIVHTRHSDVTVLGTHFNIMAYPDEKAVETTLLEGSVKVFIPGEAAETIIRPDEQAVVSNAGRHIEVKKVNAADVAAWIHGLLSLNDCSVQEFMNQLSRWYNVDIEYEGKIPPQKFGGMINRNAQLSDVLLSLEAAGIHTKLENNTIIVLSHPS